MSKSAETRFSGRALLRRLSKNLYVRLSLLSVVTGLGGLGIWQSLPEGGTEVAQVEPAADSAEQPASLLMLDDPSTTPGEAPYQAETPYQAADSFSMPPPEEAIVRANNDDTTPPQPSPAASVYAAGSVEAAPTPAYGQPPADTASAYAPVDGSTVDDATSVASQPPVPSYTGTYEAAADTAAATGIVAAEENPRYQAPAAPPTPAVQPAPSYTAEVAAEAQPPAGSLRMQPAPEMSAGTPYVPTESQQAPQAADPGQYEPAPLASENSVSAAPAAAMAAQPESMSTMPSEPATLPADYAPAASAVSNQATASYNLQDSGTPQRPIAVPEGSERYGQLPPDGLDQLAGQGVGTPGDRQLEGPQTPNVRIEKVAPAEIQVGKAARFEIKVMNTGQSTAHQVVVLDELPRGVRFVSSAPPADQAADGALMWQVGALRSGEESTISLEVMPLEEGEIGSVATVSFQAQASVRTRCTRPQLALEHTAPKKVLIGQPVSLTIALSNPGTGAATGVIIEENVPEGLSHPAGTLLEYEVGTLRPGESRQLELTLTAERPGLIDHVVRAHGEGSLDVEHRVQVEVIAPQLELAMTGPKKRYLDRQATYTIAATNAGTAAAADVEIVSRLPRGMKFLAADNEGQYDSTSHAVFWSLKELPAGTAGQMQVTALPVEVGEQKLKVDGHAALGLEASVESLVDVEGLAELFFTVADAADPIEVGKETVYEIRVVNQGSKVASNVVATALLPQDLQAITGDGPTRASQEGGRIVFAPLPRLAPKEEAIYKIRVEGKRAGDHRITVQVVSDDTSTPVTKEESTRVYSDQ